MGRLNNPEANLQGKFFNWVPDSQTEKTAGAILIILRTFDSFNYYQVS